MSTNALPKTRRSLRDAADLTGTTKAAITFLCLGEQAGSELMQKLSTRQIERITSAMSRLGPIPSEVVEMVLKEFTQKVISGSGSVIGSASTAESMLRKFMPEDQVKSILDGLRTTERESAMWKGFSSLDETVIANYLKGEHNQTAAAILNNVDTAAAAKVLPLLGADRMHDIAERMIAMEAVPLHMMQQIEETLKHDILSNAIHTNSVETHQRMADLFNQLDGQAFEELSVELERRIPDAFQAIKQRMFVFEDLFRMPTQDLALVMRGLDGATLPLAMRGAKKEQRDHLMECLPQRSRQMLMDEMAATGPVRGRDVRAAQAEMVEYAKRLSDEGVIELPSTVDDDDELYD